MSVLNFREEKYDNSKYFRQQTQDNQ